MPISQEQPIRTGPILTILLIGAVAAILNQTVLNVALTTLSNQFAVPTTKVQWLITLYMLLNGVFVPITAYLMDRFSTRQLFFTAMISFSIGTLLCGAAPNFGFLLAGRVVQATGAGIIMPLLFTVVFRLFPREKRGAAMGIVGVAIMFAPAVGPSLAGFLISQWSWRFIFFAILPFSLFALIASVFFLKNISVSKAKKLDVPGVITSTFGFGGLLYGVSIAGEKGWDHPLVWTALGVGLISLVLFVIRQRTADEPLIDLSIFKSFEFTLSVGISFFVNCIIFSSIIMLPIYLQEGRGLTALESGLFLLPGSLVMILMSPIAGKLFDRHGIKGIGMMGLILLLLSTAFYTNLTYSTGIVLMAVVYMIRSFGLAFIIMPLTTAGLNALRPELHGHGTAMQNTLLNVSGAIGTAIMTTVMTAQSNRYALKEAAAAGSERASSDPPVAIDGFIYGINSSFMLATLLAVVALAGMVVLVVYLNRQKKGKAAGRPGNAESDQNRGIAEG